MGWAPGTQVGSYEVLAFLGNGGMGEVYKVRHIISQRIEAIKLLLTASGNSPEIAERFVREIRVLANLSHPNIAGLHTAFHHEHQLIMVMEFVDGISLAEWLTRGMKLQDSLEYSRQVLSALDYAHTHGVIHRDIKPSNIMINSSGGVKLLDFGLARVTTPGVGLTSSRSLLGSVHYISPEQIRGEPLDARSDLYALGVTLYELLTGRLPIQGDSLTDIIRGHLETVPQSPSSLNRSIPEKLSEIVLRSLMKNPDDRFQSAAEFLSALATVQPENSADFDATMQRTLDISAWPTPRHNPGEPVSRSSDHATQKYDKAVLEDISQQLATYVGPIAKIIVKRASGSSKNLRELCDKVAQEIDSENYRKSFLSSVRKHLHTSGEF